MSGDVEMNAVVISDLHAHNNWPFSKTLPDGRNSRFVDLLNVLDQVKDFIERVKPKDLLILGDLTHRRHFINFALYNELMEKIYTLTERVNFTTILTGNHDLESDTVHSLYAFNHLPNTEVIDEPEVVVLGDSTPVYVVPYLPSPMAVSDAIVHAPTGMPLLSHYAAEGVKLETDYYLESPLKLGELGKFPLTLFGHVHRPSVHVNPRVIYVGAPMHFDFGDLGDRYMYHVTDLAMEGDGTFVAEPLDFPRFVTAVWPKLPVTERPGFLRLLDVPAGKIEEAKRAALDAGWLDVIALEGALPPEIREAIAGGLTINEDLLIAHIEKRCPDLLADEKARLLDEGLALLREARR